MVQIRAKKRKRNPRKERIVRYWSDGYVDMEAIVFPDGTLEIREEEPDMITTWIIRKDVSRFYQGPEGSDMLLHETKTPRGVYGEVKSMILKGKLLDLSYYLRKVYGWN